MSAPTHRFRDVFLRVLGAALGAGILVAVLDVAQAALRSSEPLPLSSALDALAAAVGLYGVAALPLGLAAATVLASMAAALPDDFWASERRRLRDDGERDARVAAALLAAGAVAGLLAVV